MTGGGGHDAPPLRHVLETCLYVSDMARARGFYEEVLGLRPHFAEDRITGYRIAHSMLLLFKAGGTLQPVQTGGGIIPPHDGSGPAHFAFSIPQDSQEEWVRWLTKAGVELLSTVEWRSQNARSLYFHDPDGHLVELATPGLWGIA